VSNRIVQQVDMRTGELMEGCLVYVPQRPKIRKGWFMAFQDAFIELAKDREITGEIRRVLDYFFGKLDFENYIHLTQTEIAEVLGMQKTNVSRAVKTLCDKKIILKGPKTGKAITYRLNSNYGWKGKVRNLQEERFKGLQVIRGGKDDTPIGMDHRLSSHRPEPLPNAEEPVKDVVSESHPSRCSPLTMVIPESHTQPK